MALRNILLDGLGACVLCDFGLSKVMHTGADGSDYYTHKSGGLPFRWMAPESFKGNRFTVKTDVWSMGVVMWQLLSQDQHDMPYAEVTDNLQVMLGLVDGSLDLRPSLPTDPIWSTLAALARQCLDRDPDQRPTAAQASARLRGSSEPSAPSISSTPSTPSTAAASSAAAAAGSVGAEVAAAQPVVAAPQRKVGARDKA